MQILLFKGGGIVSHLIQWQTRSEYSHAAVGFPTGEQFEATHPAGVRLVNWAEYEGREIDVYEVLGVELFSKAEADALAFAREQLGKPYDLTMVARFVTRRQESRKQSGKWFCSEYAYAVASRARPIFARTEPWEVPPGMLERSIGLRFYHSFKVPKQPKR